MTYQGPNSTLARAAARLGGNPLGRYLLSQTVMTAAPYFRSLDARFESVEPGRVVATLKKRRAVTNHIGSVHAIAMCNLAEWTGGVCMEVSVDRSLRWIPVGMEVEYLKIARTDLRAVSELTEYRWTTAQDVVSPVDVFDTDGQLVFTARIRMRLSEKRAAA